MKNARHQVAALPLRWKKGSVQVLMVTSRERGRWIVPKGWTMKGVKPWAAAAIEALEEAGVKGTVAQDVFGTYTYKKILADGKSVKCKVRVFPMIVEKIQSKWKERDERKRAWYSAEKAAKLVSEPELAELLLSLARKPKKAPVAGPMLRKAAS